MEKGSAPPMENNQMQQAMPAAPPSYEQSVGTSGGFAAPPPNQMYPPLSEMQKGQAPPPMQQPVQVVTQVQYVQAPNFGPRPVNMVCPNCQQNITTATDSEPSALAWVVGAVLCLVGLWPCACVPCCVDSLQQVSHKCPQCKNFLGRYRGGL